jgi:hypothetical protein
MGMNSNAFSPGQNGMSIDDYSMDDEFGFCSSLTDKSSCKGEENSSMKFNGSLAAYP